ncbi:MAG: hypothetical protein R3C59_12850 [Planctomycetaceae bacterium]
MESARNPLLAKVIHEYRVISEIFGKSELLEALRQHDSQRARQLMTEQN